MKRVSFVLVVLLILVVSASAQNEIKPVFYAGGGLGMPSSPSAFSDFWKTGFGFGGGLGAQFSRNLEVIGKFFYNTFPMDGDALLEGFTGITIDGGEFKVMEFGADVKYMFSTGPESPFAPFFVAGLGLANVKVGDVTLSDPEESVTIPFGDYSETKFALSGGAGFDYMFAPKAGLWVEARYALVFTEGESTGYLPLRAGVKVLFGE